MRHQLLSLALWLGIILGIIQSITGRYIHLPEVAEYFVLLGSVGLMITGIGYRWIRYCKTGNLMGRE